ncbi:uncharacterized protein LOC102042531, partial [Geospiza fortis]|uniref:Cytosolic arginine sensor for mTORC1 subunit 1 n=1 Tax=Geospiza fortis TaxID=48883 RepID=A0A8N5EW25_GEOFO
MLNNWDKWMAKKHKKIRLRCQKGIPPSLRGRAWQYLSGSKVKLEQNMGKFDELDLLTGDPKWLDVIERDLHRQFPFHEMFVSRGGHGQQDLFRVLKAYTLYRPEEGYCQAQAPIAAVLLMHMPAEQAFWCLVQICEKYLPGYYSEKLEAIQLDGQILFSLLHKVSPVAYKHLSKQKIDPILYMTEWFMCAFSRTLPWSSVLRVWDMFFCEGVKIIFRVGLVLLKHTLGSSDKLKSCQGQYETMERLRALSPKIMQEAFLVQEVIELPVTERQIEREHLIQLKKWRETHGELQCKSPPRLHGAKAISEAEPAPRKGRSQGVVEPRRGGPRAVPGRCEADPGQCGAVLGRSRGNAGRSWAGPGGVRVLSLARRGLWLYTHPLLKLLFLPQRCRCKFFSLTETPEDYTVMLDEEGFKELPPSEFMQVADSTWLVLSVVSNGREPPGCQATGVTKIARSVIAPLAEHHVSVLMLSTYQTDFILVRERDLPVVIHTLAGEFDIYKEEGGECVPVTCDDVSNGFLKPKPPASPTLHPVQSPQTRFCVLTVAPDTLPAIATMLIDVLFYSHAPPWDAAPGSQDLDSITFFSFSLIEGYISIVMDAETQKRFPSDLLLTSSTGELWRMVRIGGQPLGFDECGIVAQIAEPLAAPDISGY